MSNVKRYTGLLLDTPPHDAPAEDAEYVLASNYDALAAENAQLRKDLIAGICAVFHGECEKADAILSKYWKDRPPMPRVRPVSLLDAIRSPDQPPEERT